MAVGSFLSAGIAAVMFGVQYVPVKKYEIFDGTTFQWFMCNGILTVGTILAIITGDLQSRPVSLLCMAGGALWALSNYIVIPLVNLLGIGLGFALYHFVNLVVGYAVGRFGLFGMACLQPSFPNGLLYCDLGCCILLLGFALMVCVEGGQNEQSHTSGLPPRIVGNMGDDDHIDEFRKRYRQWRLGEAKGAEDEVRKFVIRTVGVQQRGAHRFFNFGLYGKLNDETVDTISETGTLVGVAMPKHMSEPAQLNKRLLDEPNPNDGIGRKLLGVFLALIGGVLCAINNVPPSHFGQEHPELGPYAAVFSQCLGIWLASTAIYVFYSNFAQLLNWRVPHSVIRPAFLSGCIWTVGFACMLGGIKGLGYSIGYTLDAVGPVAVSSVISIVVYKEITGAKQLIMFAISFACQFVGVALIAIGGHS